MELIKGLMEREMGVHVFAASALVAGALGFEVLPDLTAPAEPVRPAVFATAAPTFPLRGGLPGRMVAAPAMVEKAKASPKPLGLDEFIGMAKKAAPKPLAKKFADEFVAQPELREALVDFRREQGVNGPASDFLKKVARLPEFGDLLGRFRSEPGFKGAFLSLAQEPRAEAALRGVGTLAAADAAPAKRGERKPLNRLAAARVGGQKGLSTEQTGASQKLGGAATASAPGSTSAGGPAASSPSSPSSSSFEATSTGSGPRNAPVADVPRIGSTHEVGKIDAFSSVDKTKDSGTFFDSLFATASPELRAKLDYQCEVNNICNPLEACVAANVWDQCLAACNANVRCTGILPDKAPEKLVAKVAEELGLDEDKKPQDLKGGEDKGGGLKINMPDLANFKAEKPEGWYQSLGAAIDGGIGSAIGYALGYLWDGVDGGPKGAEIGREIGAQIGIWVTKGVETVLGAVVKGISHVVGGVVGAVGSILTGGGIRDAFEGAKTGWDVGGQVGGAILDWAGGATKAVGGWFGGLFA